MSILKKIVPYNVLLSENMSCYKTCTFSLIDTDSDESPRCVWILNSFNIQGAGTNNIGMFSPQYPFWSKKLHLSRNI